MSGYFSNIARQSGLRFMGPKASPAGTVTHGTDTRSSRVSPIDVEEVVVAPSTLDEDTATPSGTDDAPKTTSDDEGMTVVTKGAAGVLASFNPFQPLVAPSEIHDRVREDASIVRLGEDMSSKGGIQTVEFKPGRHAGETDTVVEHREMALELGGEEPGTAVSSEQRQGKKSIRRMAEIMDRSDGNAAEAHTIILKGVQEWIAAGPAAPEKHEVRKEKIQASSPREHSEIAQPWESEPGVVRIGRSDRPEFRLHDRPMQIIPGIQEQVFDLSIGTISVVIEDDKQSPQLAPSRRSESGPGKRESRPSPSRLSRNYI